MTWLRWETTTPQSDVVGHLAEELHVSLPHALGLYVACCLTFGEHRPDGNAEAVTNATLEQWALWTGKPGVFAAAFRKRCVSDGSGQDEAGVIRGWWRQYALIEKQARDAAKRKPPKNPRGFLEGTPDKPSKNPQEPAGYVNTSRSVPLVVGKGGVEENPRAAKVRDSLPPDAREAFDGLLRASPNPTALLGEISMLPERIRGATWEHIGLALRDLALAGTSRPSGLALRSFVQKAMETPANGIRLPSAPEDEYDVAIRKAKAKESSHAG